MIVIITSAHRSAKHDLKHFPLLHQVLAFWVTREGEARIGRPHVAAVVVADRELCVAPLLIGLVHDANVAAPENGALLRIVSDRELSEVKLEFLSHVQTEDKAFLKFIRRPVFFGGPPGDGSVAADDLSELSLNEYEGMLIFITSLVELSDVKLLL
jgi:hypothetical protein